MIALGIRDQVRAIVEAADEACRQQTPPKGGGSPFYVCPCCQAQRSTRAEFRMHLGLCDSFRSAAIIRASSQFIQ